MPRSGSSMTAGIFAKHGVWFGQSRPPSEANARGFFENKRIKRALTDRYGKLTLAAEPHRDVTLDPTFRGEVLQIIRDEGYDDGPWGFKMSALYKPAWGDFRPKFIGVRRKNVKRANLARNMMGTDKADLIEHMIARHDAVIDTCPVIVKTDEVVAGNYTTLRAAFAYCELDFDPKIVDDFVDPSLWHY